MSRVVLDDHLLGDVLADQVGRPLGRVLKTHDPATTNLYYLRLCRAVVGGRGGRLTSGWGASQRRAIGRALVELPDVITVVPLTELAFEMAELADRYRLSSLGAEAVAAAKRLEAPLYVSSQDDGPNIRAAASAERVLYRTIEIRRPSDAD